MEPKSDIMNPVHPGTVKRGQSRLSRFGFPKTKGERDAEEMERRKERDAEIRTAAREREKNREKEHQLRARLVKERLPRYDDMTRSILKKMLKPERFEDESLAFFEVSPFLAGRIIREIDPDRKSEITPKDFFFCCLTAINELKCKNYMQRKRVGGEVSWVYVDPIPGRLQRNYEGPMYGILRTDLHFLARSVAPPEFAEEVRNLVNEHILSIQ